MTVAAMAVVAMKVLTFRSKRVVTRRQFVKRQDTLDNVALLVDRPFANELNLGIG